MWRPYRKSRRQGGRRRISMFSVYSFLRYSAFSIMMGIGKYYNNDRGKCYEDAIIKIQESSIKIQANQKSPKVSKCSTPWVRRRRARYLSTVESISLPTSHTIF